MMREGLKTCSQCDHYLTSDLGTIRWCVMRMKAGELDGNPVWHPHVPNPDDPSCEHFRPFRPLVIDPLERGIGKRIWGWRWKGRDTDTAIQAWMRKHGVVG